MFFGDLGGAQAEYVLARNADLSLLRIPDGVDDEAALLVGDNLTTAYHANGLGGVGQGSFVAVQGCGPVGLLAIQVAIARGAHPVVGVDLAPARLERARDLGAETIDVSRSNAGVAVEEFGDGRGAEIVLDTAGGDPALLVQALDLVRPGGTIAVVGVYSDPEARLPLAEMWLNAVTLRFSSTTPVPALWREVMDDVTSGAIDPRHVVTHRLPFARAVEGYDLLEARDCLKVVLRVAGEVT
jgi:threonine dehydrogenase-like Zn-dependent dehydrogenase